MVINNAKEFERSYGTMKSRGLAAEESAAMDVFRKTVAETQQVKQELNQTMQRGSQQEIAALQSRYDQLKQESSALLAVDVGYGTEVGTALAVRNAFRRGEPLTERALRILEKRNELDDEVMDLGPSGPPYRSLDIDGTPYAGIADITGRLPDAIPNYWSVYFGVENTDEAVHLIEQRGGMVITPPVTTPNGRWATVADPMNAVFVIISG